MEVTFKSHYKVVQKVDFCVKFCHKLILEEQNLYDNPYEVEKQPTTQYNRQLNTDTFDQISFSPNLLSANPSGVVIANEGKGDMNKMDPDSPKNNEQEMNTQKVYG